MAGLRANARFVYPTASGPARRGCLWFTPHDRRTSCRTPQARIPGIPSPKRSAPSPSNPLRKHRQAVRLRHPAAGPKAPPDGPVPLPPRRPPCPIGIHSQPNSAWRVVATRPDRPHLHPDQSGGPNRLPVPTIAARNVVPTGTAAARSTIPLSSGRCGLRPMVPSEPRTVTRSHANRFARIRKAETPTTKVAGEGDVVGGVAEAAAEVAIGPTTQPNASHGHRMSSPPTLTATGPLRDSEATTRGLCGGRLLPQTTVTPGRPAATAWRPAATTTLATGSTQQMETGHGRRQIASTATSNRGNGVAGAGEAAEAGPAREPRPENGGPQTAGSQRRTSPTTNRSRQVTEAGRQTTRIRRLILPHGRHRARTSRLKKAGPGGGDVVPARTARLLPRPGNHSLAAGHRRAADNQTARGERVTPAPLGNAAARPTSRLCPVGTTKTTRGSNFSVSRRPPARAKVGSVAATRMTCSRKAA